MGTDPSRKPVPAWRNQAPAAARNEAALPAWRKGAAGPAPTGRLSRRTQFGIATGMFLVLVGVMAWFIYMIYRPRPAALVLVGAGYETNLAIPHNVYGWRGLWDLKQWSEESGSLPSWATRLTNRGGVHLLESEPVRLNDRNDWEPENHWKSFREPTLILYLALHGGADSQKGYLLTQDGSRLELQDVIGRLTTLTKQQKKNVLLILDATQVADDWTEGMLHNDFARRLDALNDQIKEQGRLVVLSASGDGLRDKPADQRPDERSWASEEWRQTIFCHYIIEGLKGAADLDRSGFVTAEELYKYVHEKVTKWARDNRAAVQEPVLLPRDEGPQRAATMNLVAVNRGSHTGTPPDKAPGNVGFDQVEPKLKEYWDRHDRLLEGSPPPPVYTPHLWRWYEAALLRYEQLLRAGDQDSATQMAGTLDGLEDRIAKARQLGTLDSRSRSLALRALPADKGGPVAEQDARQKFRDLWAKKVRWQQLSEEAQKNGSEEALRLALVAQLVQRGEGAADPADFGTARGLLLSLEAEHNDRPVEAHLLALLGRDLEERKTYGQKRPPLDLLQQAVRTCRLGEEAALSAGPVRRGGQPAYAYSEFIYPWIEADLRQADEARRRGENLVFAEGDTSWKVAGQDLRQAEDGYRAVQRRAEAVRQALTAYHEAQDWLPWYAQYLARTKENGAPPLDEVEALLGGPTDSDRGGDVDRLAALLRNHDERDLAETARRVENRLATLQAAFRRHCAELAERQPGEDQALWHELDAVQGVPRIPAGTRLRLVDLGRQVSQALNAGHANPPALDDSPDKARLAAQRQGRMALAVLGRERVGERYGQFREWVLAPRDPWYETLDRAGDEVHDAWKHVADRLQAVGVAADNQDAKTAREDVVLGERLARQVDGGTASLLFGDGQLIDPAEEYHHLLLQELFRGLAGRAQADHWWCEADLTTPYYTAAGGAYLKDAEGRGLRHAALKAEQKALAEDVRNRLRPVGLQVAAPAKRLALTDEPDLTARFAVTEPPGMPRGDAVAWLKTDAPLRQLTPRGTERQVVRGGAEQSVPCTVAPPENRAVATTGLQLEARYRGQIVHSPLPVVLAGLPDPIVYQHPPTPKARIAIRSKEDLYAELQLRQMQVAIVFDRTASMGEHIATHPKLAEAAGALRTVLRSLPAGPKVSVWTFGHLTGNKSERLIAPERWTPDRTDFVIEKIDSVKTDPLAFSPIVHAMMDAARTDLGLKLKGEGPRIRPSPTDDENPGVKILLVLTDGGDQQFKDDAEYNKEHKRIDDYLKEQFDDSDIKVVIVGFKFDELPTREEREGAKQFEIVRKLQRQPGIFTTADDKAELVDAFKGALRLQPLRCRIQQANGEPVNVARDGKEGLPVQRPADAREPSLPLPPEQYEARMPTSRGGQQLELSRGDMLLMNFTRRGFERALYKEEQEQYRRHELPSNKLDSWLVSVHESRLLGNRRTLQMLLAAESDANRNGNDVTLRQVRPRFVWFNLEAQDTKEAPRGIRWRNVGDLLNLPAPAWRLNALDWPEEALPRVTAWVHADDPSRDTRLASVFTHPAGKPPEALFESHSALVGEGQVKVTDLSVSFEPMQVEEKPGQPVERSCMVVRLEYPPDSPVLARPDEFLPVQGQEHRFYPGINHYTGIFWPVTADQARKADFTMALISLKAVMARQGIEINVPRQDRDLRPPQELGLDRLESSLP